MKKITLVVVYLLAISLISCIRTPDQASKQINKLLERFPTAAEVKTVTIVKIDTVIVHDTIVIEKTDKKAIEKTYNSMDSLVNLLKKKDCDTVFIEVIKKQLKNKCTIQNLLQSPVLVDTLGVKGKVYAKDNTVIVDLVRTIAQINKETDNASQVIIGCPETPFYKDKWFWAFILACLFIVLILLKK